jgi:hypothetical protein
VLVTGVNGIRKTTSVYQAWFKHALALALDDFDGDEEDLPGGGDSFFRQLDFMIATVANERFRALYAESDRGAYSKAKQDIFASFRCAAEMLGVLLVRAAQRKRMNVLVETSGRDAAMFEYVRGGRCRCSYCYCYFSYSYSYCGAARLLHSTAPLHYYTATTTTPH